MIKIDIRTVIYHYILFHLGKQGKSLLKHKLQSHFQPLFHIPLFPQKIKKRMHLHTLFTTILQCAPIAEWPVNKLRFSYQQFFRHKAPHTAIGRMVSVIATHEVLPIRH